MDHVRRFDVRVHAGVGLVAAVARHVVLRQGVRPGAPPLAVRLQLSLQRVLPPSLLLERGIPDRLPGACLVNQVGALRSRLARPARAPCLRRRLQGVGGVRLHIRGAPARHRRPAAPSRRGAHAAGGGPARHRPVVRGPVAGSGAELVPLGRGLIPDNVLRKRPLAAECGRRCAPAAPCGPVRHLPHAARRPARALQRHGLLADGVPLPLYLSQPLLRLMQRVVQVLLLHGRGGRQSDRRPRLLRTPAVGGRPGGGARVGRHWRGSARPAAGHAHVAAARCGRRHGLPSRAQLRHRALQRFPLRNLSLQLHLQPHAHLAAAAGTH
mmetsp:Transcript_25004/g.63037  ORF Transcript_25004/g.63037 Transcript_25004/m.63037 type:complete len:325 (-) Transcript_25004:840-1814(-)